MNIKTVLRSIKNYCMFVLPNNTSESLHPFLLKVKERKRAGHAVKFRFLQIKHILFGVLCNDLPSIFNLNLSVMHNTLKELLETSGGANRHKANFLELLKTYARHAEKDGGIDADVITTIDWMGQILDEIENYEPKKFEPCNS